MNAWAKQKGFTIVELLIVIVVIGILAAITVVAYNGIQDRARMATAMAFERQLRDKYGVDTTGSWSFDECSGTTVSSVGPVNETDTITGTASWITDTPTGRGCALHFDGATRIETQATLGAKYYVKGAWVRIPFSNCGNNNNILSQAQTNGAVAAFYAPGCKPAAGNNGSWNTVSSPTSIGDNKWHYLATEWVDGIQKLYVDGALITSTSSPTALNNPSGFVSIGAHAGGNTMYGDIDNPFVAAGN